VVFGRLDAELAQTCEARIRLHGCPLRFVEREMTCCRVAAAVLCVDGRRSDDRQTDESCDEYDASS
jgi:hypothetical protein